MKNGSLETDIYLWKNKNIQRYREIYSKFVTLPTRIFIIEHLQRITDMIYFEMALVNLCNSFKRLLQISQGNV
jgi:hypothetical protein